MDHHIGMREHNNDRGDPADADNGVRYLDVDGAAVRYKSTGRGDPVLLLHAFTRSLEDWSAQHRLLGAGYQVISVDLAGYGRSAPSPQGHSLDGLARFVGRFADAVGITAPIRLIGNSLGGTVAMRYAVMEPARVRDVVLVNAAGFGRRVHVLVRLMGVRATQPLVRPSMATMRAVERLLYHDRGYVTDDGVTYALSLMTTPHAKRVTLETGADMGDLRGLYPGWRERLLTQYAESGVPTLIVWGDRDRVLPVSQFRAAQACLPDATCHLLHDVGHLPQVEVAQEFSSLVLGFWGHVDAQRAEHDPQAGDCSSGE